MLLSRSVPQQACCSTRCKAPSTVSEAAKRKPDCGMSAYWPHEVLIGHGMDSPTLLDPQLIYPRHSIPPSCSFPAASDAPVLTPRIRYVSWYALYLCWRVASALSARSSPIFAYQTNASFRHVPPRCPVWPGLHRGAPLASAATPAFAPKPAQGRGLDVSAASTASKGAPGTVKIGVYVYERVRPLEGCCHSCVCLCVCVRACTHVHEHRLT